MGGSPRAPPQSPPAFRREFPWQQGKVPTSPTAEKPARLPSICNRQRNPLPPPTGCFAASPGRCAFWFSMRRHDGEKRLQRKGLHKQLDSQPRPELTSCCFGAAYRGPFGSRPRPQPARGRGLRMVMEIRPETSDPAQRKPAGSRSREQAQKMGRSRATNDPAFLPPATTNLRRARRRRDLVAMFLNACGGREASELTLVAIRKAAELTVAAEAARAAVLNGGSCAADLDVLIKLENEARRAVRALGLKVDSAKPHGSKLPPPWSPLRAALAKAAPAAEIVPEPEPEAVAS
jgi:hypothetical protein